MIELLKKILKWCTPYGFFLYREKRQQKRQQLNVDYQRYQKEFQPQLISHHLVLFKDQALNVFGQGGEDLLLRAFMKDAEKSNGFYVDIGAFHPVRASNTKYFYDRGWRGINIEANPESAVLFKEMRPRDINLTIGVSDENSMMEFYYFGPEHSINTFNERQAAAFSQHFKLPIKEVISMPVRHINEVLQENIPINQKIDFLSLDIEGLEQKILQAIDFNSFRPNYLLIEDIALEGDELNFENWQKLQHSVQHQFVEAQGYELLGKSPLTLLYRNTKQ